MTALTVASPVDFDRYGDYSPPPAAFVSEGGTTRLSYPFGGRITDDGSSGHPAEVGRYHLYVSHYCPWAQRPLIALKLRGLDHVVSWSAVDPVRDGRGWAFRDGPGHTPDPINGFALLGDAYRSTDPSFAGHISVPVLWDRATNRLLSNHYPTLTADLETQFAAYADPQVHLYPEDRRAEIDALNEGPTAVFIAASFAGLSARTQEQHDGAAQRVFAALASFEERLASQRFLLGDRLTDADLLLYVNLIRFELVIAPLARFTERRLVDHPNLWAYTRDLYQRPAFRTATFVDHIKDGTYRTRPGLNPSRIVASGPVLDWDAPHGREHFATPQ